MTIRILFAVLFAFIPHPPFLAGRRRSLPTTLPARRG